MPWLTNKDRHKAAPTRALQIGVFRNWGSNHGNSQSPLNDGENTGLD